MKSITELTNDYNKFVEKYMKNKYNSDQIVKENTTNYYSTLYLCFTNITLKYSIIWNYWSDHRILSVAIDI